MSDYLTDGWPLFPTSTVYMDGTALFYVRDYGKPGILASVTMTHEQAQIIRDVVSRQVATAYEEGVYDGG